ncbi:Ig-like domain-containing protein [Rhodococcus spongiicola]|uniref:Ig-like domain-containing protein n=1 Tax=Rhodococcus spongiicola TaxID=2487352 RepID=UPI0013E29B23|nr:Ig-like domain-containing protein [Rhodococcus spongiicola]
MATGFAATVGAGSAAADSDSETWSDGDVTFTRTVSDATPEVGDVVTVTTKFELSEGSQLIWRVADYHPACWELADADYPLLGITSTSTEVTGLWRISTSNSKTFSFDYRVTADCDRGTPLSTGMSYIHTSGWGAYEDSGPTVTVAKGATTTWLAAVSGSVLAGESVTLTATVTGGAQGDPVDFYDGDTKVGSGQLNASGVATYEWTPAATGMRSVQAKFPSTDVAQSSESTLVQVGVTETASGSSGSSESGSLGSSGSSGSSESGSLGSSGGGLFGSSGTGSSNS